MSGLEQFAPLCVSQPPKVGCLVAVVSKCPAEGTQVSPLCHHDCCMDMDVRETNRRPFGLRLFCCTWKGEVQPDPYRCLQQQGVLLLLIAESPAAARVRDQEGQLQPSPAAGQAGPGTPCAELRGLVLPRRVCTRDCAGSVCQERVCSWGHPWVKLAAPLSVFPVITPAALCLCELELHLVWRVYQVQHLHLHLLVLPGACVLKVWLKSEQGNTAHDAWEEPACATDTSPVCRTSGK